MHELTISIEYESVWARIPSQSKCTGEPMTWLRLQVTWIQPESGNCGETAFKPVSDTRVQSTRVLWKLLAQLETKID